MEDMPLWKMCNYCVVYYSLYTKFTKDILQSRGHRDKKLYIAIGGGEHVVQGAGAWHSQERETEVVWDYLWYSIY